MFGRNGNFTGNALLGQIAADHRKPLKWTRDLTLLGARRDRVRVYSTERGVYAQGNRDDYLVTPIIDTWANDKTVGWNLTINPGTTAERVLSFDTQREAKENAAVIERHHP
jgi:hypothetical protein